MTAKPENVSRSGSDFLSEKRISWHLSISTQFSAYDTWNWLDCVFWKNVQVITFYQYTKNHKFT